MMNFKTVIQHVLFCAISSTLVTVLCLGTPKLAATNGSILGINGIVSTVYAADSGTIEGSTVTWSRSGSTLTIGGSGDMPRYVTGDSARYPYQQNASSITSIVINEGVTYISEYAFSMFPNVTSVTLPTSIRQIGAFAFKEMNALREITIPSGAINEGAFILCQGLQTVNIGSGVTEIGVGAFESCNSITKVNISDLAAWCNIDFGGVHANPLNRPNMGNTHLYLNGSLITDLTIPDSVTSIPDYAFINCPDIQNVIIPASVTTIGQHAFRADTGLTHVYGAGSLKSIGAAAFNGTNLQTFDFHENLEYIGSYAFRAVPLTQMSIDHGYIGEYAFADCGQIWMADVDSSVTISNSAFANCGAIKNNIPINSSKTIPTTFTLGNYGGEAIEWKVLTVQDGKALAVSSKVLDYRKSYDNSSDNVNGWAGSSARTWLNSTFYNSAFNDGEKAKIISTNVSTGANPKYGTPGGAIANGDKMFFLSAEEITRYMSTPDSRKAVTRARNEYDGSIDESSGGTAYYWLRDNGMAPDLMVYVDYAGYIHYDGAYNTNPEIYGVRPAIWVDAGAVGISESTQTVTTSTGHTNAEDADIWEFVKRLYRKCLNREPDYDGCANWVNQLKYNPETGRSYSDGVNVAYGFFNSPEMASLGLSDSEYVERLYQVLMNRGSDPSGKQNWVNCLENGVRRVGVFRGFAESSEFTEVCQTYGITRGTLNPDYLENRDKNFGITRFVARCYTKVLGRGFDVDGLNNWCDQIISASSQRQKAVSVSTTGFFDSSEFIERNLSNEDFVDVLYRTFLDREADADGKANWVSQLESGRDRHDIMAGFYNSSEFNELMTSYGIN